LAFLGGVPRCIVPDNLKAGVSNPCCYEPGINPSYQEFAEHYGVAIIPARPYKPRDKAKVEKAVQEVERQVLAPLQHERFGTLGDLNAAIGERLQLLNERVMHGYGVSRRVLFEQVDQPALLPLPTQPFVFAKWKQAKVNLDYHIEVERHYYSVPYWFVQQSVNVKITEQMIEVFQDGKRIAAHERGRLPHRHTTLADHMPPEHYWAYKRQSKERFVAWAQQVGVQTTRQVEAMFERKDHEEQAFRTVRGLQALVSQYGSARVEAACRRANTFGIVSLRRIRSMLQTQMDKDPLPSEPPLLPVTLTMMNPLTVEQLKELRLIGMLEAWSEQQTTPTYHDLGFDERLALLVEREQLRRSQQRLQRRLKQVQLSTTASLSDIDFTVARGLSKSKFLELAQGNTIEYGYTNICN
jgi:transposase